MDYLSLVDDSSIKRALQVLNDVMGLYYRERLDPVEISRKLGLSLDVVKFSVDFLSDVWGVYETTGNPSIAMREDGAIDIERESMQMYALAKSLFLKSKILLGVDGVEMSERVARRLKQQVQTLRRYLDDSELRKLADDILKTIDSSVRGVGSEALGDCNKALRTIAEYLKMFSILQEKWVEINRLRAIVEDVTTIIGRNNPELANVIYDKLGEHTKK